MADNIKTCRLLLISEQQRLINQAEVWAVAPVQRRQGCTFLAPNSVHNFWRAKPQKLKCSLQCLFNCTKFSNLHHFFHNKTVPLALSCSVKIPKTTGHTKLPVTLNYWSH